MPGNLHLSHILENLLDGWPGADGFGLVPGGVADERGDDVGLGVHIRYQLRVARILAVEQGLLYGSEGKAVLDIWQVTRSISDRSGQRVLEVSRYSDLAHGLQVVADQQER